eukprot:TRINITY_DN12806_c0_g1_i2.p2 TRINITY_DN12806_c0_g1~~TRINITY_DN12806_c0_g1_i2.p2  ORF type:complete len:147 (-),score=38.12 TRINITY_DN12806_c0_g1_i2:152-592(-)
MGAILGELDAALLGGAAPKAEREAPKHRPVDGVLTLSQQAESAASGLVQLLWRTNQPAAVTHRVLRIAERIDHAGPAELRRAVTELRCVEASLEEEVGEEVQHLVSLLQHAEALKRAPPSPPPPRSCSPRAREAGQSSNDYVVSVL